MRQVLNRRAGCFSVTPTGVVLGVRTGHVGSSAVAPKRFGSGFRRHRKDRHEGDESDRKELRKRHYFSNLVTEWGGRWIQNAIRFLQSGKRDTATTMGTMARRPGITVSPEHSRAPKSDIPDFYFLCHRCRCGKLAACSRMCTGGRPAHRQPRPSGGPPPRGSSATLLLRGRRSAEEPCFPRLRAADVRSRALHTRLVHPGGLGPCLHPTCPGSPSTTCVR